MPIDPANANELANIAHEVEAGKMRLVEKVPGEICVFETVARVKFSVTRPALSRELALIDVLREILEEEYG